MNIVTGDLLQLAREGQFNIIVHGANCFNTMGSGIARQIREQYPEAYEADCRTERGARSKLGTYSVMLGKQFNIINAYVQYGFNKPGENKDVFEYEAFQQVLNKLAEQYPVGCRFGFPLIGQGLAGGDPVRIMAMIEDLAEKIEAQYGSVTVVKYG